MAVEVNTLATPAMERHSASFIELLEDMAVERWNVFFLVPAVGSRGVPMLTSVEAEDLFAVLAAARERVPFRIRTFEAPQFRRYLLQQGVDAQAATAEPIVFISDRGAITPGPFLPASAGDVRRHSLRRVYEASPLFTSLRDRTLLSGKCGHCEFRESCGGSRARALSMTGDLFGSDPLCAYQPVPPGDRGV
jgi:radical SAM protein with 4Fe4S-binding SPASM domain